MSAAAPLLSCNSASLLVSSLLLLYVTLQSAPAAGVAPSSSSLPLPVFPAAAAPAAGAAALHGAAARAAAASATGAGPPFSMGALTAFHHPAAWCTANPFLSRWEAANFTAAAASLVAARGASMSLALGTRWRAEKWGRFDGAPAAQQCHPLLRLASGDLRDSNLRGEDAGKFLCGLDALRDEGCVIYSLGSKLQFDFEMEMIMNSPCSIHTFDCTIAPQPSDPPLHERITYHHTCIAEADSADGKYRSLASIARQLGHTSIALLKMDIEGYEYGVVEALWRDGVSGGLALPYQISFEQHARTNAPLAWTDWGNWPLSETQVLGTGDIALSWALLADLGYVVIRREDNQNCIWCIEWTVVRAFC